ncbi:type 1 glutamine amidotransferase domain-containing protein [Fulvimarina sp. 2208YS6-2-32]|uniref:Type 1 glutamine amidotransferase domain-containing protein n=1 Tax=Fulvimarina uroteuthidis TaxID=3098149 RepID=A0ABU5I584_9HYPH|nr:type 1 glutamine amidotransferase domain-containing protein [Fulvimarina sp. 2208YS6-2-32]MDY8109959.1 type 1 glutamine amidotransferase domain-containing protein [Fulvimarina sp. 2208YS6-2-32]
MTKISAAKIAILATDGFEQVELTEPLAKLKEAGAQVHVISTKSGSIRGWDQDHWDKEIAVDKQLSEVRVTDYDALVLPGGQINPDVLRADPKVVSFVREFFNSKKPLAAICHAPWLLIEADVVRGRDVTSFKSIKTDLKNAGANWVDKEVVVHEALITSRNPDDLPAFIAKIIEEVEEGRHEDRKVA